MYRPTRSLVASLAVAASLWPIATSVQAQDVPRGDRVLTVEQVRGAFRGAGLQVDQPLNWDWMAPPVESFQVHDVAQDRVLMVLVYASADEAETARALAQSRQQTVSGPHLVVGYGPGIWTANLAMVQTRQSDLDRLYQAQIDRDMGFNSGSDIVHDSNLPSIAVDLDFRRVLETSVVNL
jgi:hypothetical protein